MRSVFFFWILVLNLSLSLFAKAEGVVYDVTPLMTDPADGLALLGGRELNFSVNFSAGAKVTFEDTMPGANWGHPGIFRLLDKQGGIVEEKVVQLPPLHLSAAPVIKGKKEAPNFSDVAFKLNTFEGKLKVADPENYFAVLINGRADRRHWNDFSFLYRVLTEIYGYSKSNIFVADGVNQRDLPDLDGDKETDIQFGSSKTDIEELFGKLKDTLKADSRLLIAVNDHGSTLNGESTIVLFDTEITASDFAKLVDAVPAKTVLSIFEQCFSGGFVRPSSGKTKVSMAAATNQEYSWASMDLLFDEFIYHVISGFAKQGHDGKAVPSDLNLDGRVSAQEAFAYAVGRDLRKESPVLETGVNAGMSARIGLGF